jgi:amidophosphoribosyltransferase
MSDPIRHECGIAVVRLRKPLEYYQAQHGTALWGFHKLYALMAKQRNRGHDGTGIGSCKLNMPLGQPYMFRLRSSKKDALDDMFEEARKDYVRDMRRLYGNTERKDEERYFRPEILREHFDYSGQILMGHLRYGTSGTFGKGSCHPYLRRSNWPTKSLMVMGNFNMTNTAELHRIMIERGQHPVYGTDTQTVLEEIGFHLDELHTDIYRALKEHFPGSDIPQHISDQLDVPEMVRRSAQHWDGGYAICGAVGNGDMFVIRDPNGIRPCFYYENEEVFAFASERARCARCLMPQKKRSRNCQRPMWRRSRRMVWRWAWSHLRNHGSSGHVHSSGFISRVAMTRRSMRSAKAWVRLWCRSFCRRRIMTWKTRW